MFSRTDLAIEACAVEPGGPGASLVTHKSTHDGIDVTKIEIRNAAQAKQVGKEIGTYITLEVSPFSKGATDGSSEVEALGYEVEEVPYIPLAEELGALLPPKKEAPILVVGLGNTDITPDALGPKVISKTLATRHLTKEFLKEVGLPDLRGVCAIAPGVLGKTGLETGEIVRSVADAIHPCAIIVIDALAARGLGRLGATIQLSNSGISPGSGVHNRRFAINRENMGAPVISLGVPTVVDASTLAAELISPDDEADAEKLKEMTSPRGSFMIVTPRDIDLIIKRASEVLALGINRALHPHISAEDLNFLVS